MAMTRHSTSTGNSDNIDNNITSDNGIDIGYGNDNDDKQHQQQDDISYVMQQQQQQSY